MQQQYPMDRAASGPISGESAAIPVDYNREEREAFYQQMRLRQFRAQHKAMGWLYRLLDVGYGVDLAVAEIDRLRSASALKFALAFDAMLCLLFGLIWWRYDLMSTWTVLNPLATSLYGAIPKEGEFWGAFMGTAGFLVEILMRVAVTLGPSFVQFRMPQMAMNHDAAWIELRATAVFDMGTDSVDVREDTPQFFGWLIEAAGQATPDGVALDHRPVGPAAHLQGRQAHALVGGHRAVPGLLTVRPGGGVRLLGQRGVLDLLRLVCRAEPVSGAAGEVRLHREEAALRPSGDHGLARERHGTHALRESPGPSRRECVGSAAAAAGPAHFPPAPPAPSANTYPLPDTRRRPAQQPLVGIVRAFLILYKND